MKAGANYSAKSMIPRPAFLTILRLEIPPDRRNQAGNSQTIFHAGAEMTNAKLTTLLTGALIVAALWFRVFVVVANPTSHVIDSTDDAEVINSDTMPPEEVLVALKNMDVSSKICTTDKG